MIEPINNLIKLFVFPSNLISKRNKKLLDFDSAQSAYDKVKDQQLTQVKKFKYFSLFRINIFQFSGQTNSRSYQRDLRTSQQSTSRTIADSL